RANAHQETERQEEIMTHPALSRRTLLGAGAAAVAGVAAGLPVRPALAKAPQLNTQAPYFYRFRIGSIEATVVSDGALPLGEPSASFLRSEEHTSELQSRE